MKRNYIFHLPTSHDPKIASPLLIVFHGALMDGKGMRDATNLNDIADRRGFIVVYPDGYKRT
ncbi:MAG TPA: PHB depolymerase family esterase, partial [Thermodesulfobacteriota bacterium]|nr:PHB depolymerase family esterase [Thermodesulfobacteriota bacterium]